MTSSLEIKKTGAVVGTLTETHVRVELVIFYKALKKFVVFIVKQMRVNWPLLGVIRGLITN
jgi:hypothetical protein